MNDQVQHTERTDERLKEAERNGRDVEVTIRRRGRAWDCKVVVRSEKGVEIANRSAGASTYAGLQTAFKNLLETLP